MYCLGVISMNSSERSIAKNEASKFGRFPDDDDSHNDQGFLFVPCLTMSYEKRVPLDICRVCRLAGDDTLYHPCLCTGSIKYVHQDCLMQWLKYSKKDVCELCNHKFSFRPVYRNDMPERLPLYDLVKGCRSLPLSIA